MRKIFLFLAVLLLKSQISFSTQIDTNHIYGLTVDGISPLAQIDTSLARLCKKPTTRIVFDTGEPATNYVQAVNEISKFSFIMGEILDSYRFSTYTLQQFIDRTNEYYNAFSNKIDIWEIGNEINGSWNGPIDSTVLKTTAAYNIIKSNNKKTALTLFYCWDDQQHQMYYWVNHNLSASMRNGLDYVFVSYYEDDCGGYQPNWQRVFDSLHVMFPNAKLGIGECGTSDTTKKASFINRYYKMNISTPNYVGGYFWWYWRQDCIPQTDTLWTVFCNSISNYPAPLTQASQITYIPVSPTSVSLNWTNGSGSSRVIFVKEGNSGNPLVLDGTTYTGDSKFGFGTPDGTGWYCVYNGSSGNSLTIRNSLTISNLNSSQVYYVKVLEYNGFSGFEGYNNNTAANNPNLIQSTSQFSLALTALLSGHYDGTTMVPINVTVELRNSTTPYAIVEYKTVCLSTSGTGNPLFTNAVNSTPYYIVLKFNNGLETWSATPQTFIKSSLNYDFTTAANKAYGNNMILVGTKWCIISGDINQTGSIDAFDRSVCWNERNLIGNYLSDLNGDSVVNAVDRGILANTMNYLVKKPGLLDPKVGVNCEKSENKVESKGEYDLKLNGSNSKKVKKKNKI